MAPKRKRRASPSPKGLAAGEKLKREKLAGSDSSAWGWVDTEVTDVSKITFDHCLRTCGFSPKNRNPFCPNKYALKCREASEILHQTNGSVDGELDGDVIVISDDEGPICSKKSCKNNPNCLNYLGQDKWEDEEEMWETFMKSWRLGEDPVVNSRDPELPVGLKNLGATCYANAFLQVWFRDLAFRNGVYQCHTAADSPIFQLQVTFAALQESTQAIFNPSKLVESLQLRSTEQQDASEFSKLFMSHLESEFQKQPDPSLRSLVIDQFQGKQVYGTICESCHFRSERDADFLEIEINFENNSKLEDRVAALLEPERLFGDNQYSCPQCNGLKDATRYTELRKLPPVLHFSLLRFVYDMSSMERKKSKHAISFPLRLDMGRFIGSATQKNGLTLDTVSEYELRGVLLHKGTSAYHGHYEAQVYDDTEQAWFQCNDEVVTRITSLNGQPKKRIKPTKRTYAKKRRVMDDSDDEIVELNLKDDCDISSKDAYMLIYARADKSSHNPTKAQINPTPPPAALEAIDRLNAVHDEACEQFDQKKHEAKSHFETLRSQVMDIYRTWSVSNQEEESVIVSQEAIEKWLSTEAIDTCISQANGVDPSSTPDRDSSEEPVYEHVCSHGELDPEFTSDMKRVSSAAYSKLEALSSSIGPARSPDEVCSVCVERIFKERLYQIEHPRDVARFDKVSEVQEGRPGYWISKEWLKDWRLVKPKMHKPCHSQNPNPDTADHVKCEHGGLSHNSAARRRISVEACQILQNLFPTWKPTSDDEELCPVCDTIIHASKEGRLGSRKQAEDEKAMLKHMHDNALNGNTMLLENVPCALISAQFVRTWRQWISRPADAQRPNAIDNSVFICEHSLLVFDPNSDDDWDTSATLIKKSDWNIVEQFYTGGPFISLEKKDIECDNGVFQTKFVHEVPVCVDCRRKRKLDFDSTDINIRIWNAKDPIPTGPIPSAVPSAPESGPKTHLKPAGSLRQSKRIRQGKERASTQRIPVTKRTSVKDIKIFLQTELNIPTIYQRLFYRGQELEDNSATISLLGIMVNDTLDLREESETIDILTDEDEETPPTKRRREEERGFGGTLLSGGSRSDITDRTVTALTAIESPPHDLGKPCVACTFVNPFDAFNCTVCETPFA